MDEMTSGYQPVVDEICGLDWTALDRTQLATAAWAYYYFSIQFRENLQVAAWLHPDDVQLKDLLLEECDTDNLSPWPSVATPDEKLNHDEFMRRVLTLTSIDPELQRKIEANGQNYLIQIRKVDDQIKAMSITTYEDGGLESVFRAMLQAPHWDNPLLQGFRHFLLKHIAFDGDVERGHGAMIRHFVPDHRVRILWVAFRELLLASVPRLAV